MTSLKFGPCSVASRGKGRQEASEELLEPKSPESFSRSFRGAPDEGQAGPPETPRPASVVSVCEPMRRRSVTRPAVGLGTETEVLADALSSLSFCAAGSFVRTEPLLVSVEGEVVSTLGGVKPSTGIVGTRKARSQHPTQQHRF